MARKLLLTILLFVTACGVFAQSGRIKPKPDETPKEERPRSIFVPTQVVSSTPTPTPKVEVEQDDVISVDSNLVPIPVSVLDAKGQTVTSLKLEDFVLEVDGQKAEISELAHSESPVRLALLFDNSSSVSQAREFEKKAAIRFFKRVIRPSKDLAALYSVATITRLEQPLTKDISQLVSAIENFPQPQGATALLDGILKAAEYLKDFDGRRVIVIVSDGDDTISDLATTLEKVVRVLHTNNCQVYVVKTTDFDNYKKTGLRGGNANIKNLQAEHRMREITQQTGGAVYSPIDEKELDQAFAQISAELSQQYILSYYPEDEGGKRGTFRNIALKVKDRNDLSVRTRKSYFVPRR